MEPMTRDRTHTFLICGMIAGPLYLAVGLAQALTREGFDLGRHSLSALANGPGGWIQTLNFVVTGLLVIAAAAGIRRALRPRSGISAWILAGFGVSMLLAAIFPADPVDGFPVGTPAGMPETISTTGLIHFAAGAFGFLTLAVSCIAFGITMARSSRRYPALAWPSIIAGALVIAGFMAPAFLPAAGPVAGIWFSVVVGWAWLAGVTWRLDRGL